MWKKPIVKLFRWQATPLMVDGVLVGYGETQGELYREIMLDTYDVVLWG